MSTPTPSLASSAPDEGVLQAGMPVLHGMRLVCMASWLVEAPLDRGEILELGCGTGEFLHHAHQVLGLNVWGTDAVSPVHGTSADRFIATPGTRRFAVVMMSVPVDPSPEAARDVLAEAFARVEPGGVLVFQTPRTAGADTRAGFEQLGSALGAARCWSQAADTVVHAWRQPAAPRDYPELITIPATAFSVTALAVRDGATITDAGTGAGPNAIGPMVFGPYRDLEPGHYRVVVRARIDGTYGLKLTGDRSALVFAQQDLREGATTVEFTVRHFCGNFECVIRRQLHSRRLVLEAVELHRLGPLA